MPVQAYIDGLLCVYELNRIELKELERFVEVAETELMGLHNGNIARYRIRPAEYEKWKITRTAQ